MSLASIITRVMLVRKILTRIEVVGSEDQKVIIYAMIMTFMTKLDQKNEDE